MENVDDAETHFFSMENAVARIRDILEGDVAETPCHSLQDLLAYHDKTAELAALLGEDSASLSMTSSDNAIARIRGLLEEDDAGTALCSLQDMLAYGSLTAELAALLQEDSASLSLPRASSSQFEAPIQHLSIAETSQAVRQLTSGTMSRPDPLIPPSYAVLSDRVEGSERLAAIPSNGPRTEHVGMFPSMPSIGQLTSGTTSRPDPVIPASCVVDRAEGSERIGAIHSNGLGTERVGTLLSMPSIAHGQCKTEAQRLVRPLASILPTVREQAETEVSDVPNRLQHRFECNVGQLTSTPMFQRDPPRVSSKHGSMSISKTSLYDEYIGKSIHMPMLPVYISLHDTLLQIAHAVGMNNTGSAMVLARKLKQQTSPHGNSLERLAHYFVKALYARFEGTGWSRFRKQHLSQNCLSPMNILQASVKYMCNSPFMKAWYAFVNQSILRVAKKASTLLILEPQVTGIQYPSLFKELAVLPGGPPKVRLVGMVAPHYSMLASQRHATIAFVEETGRRLSRLAEYFKVPFEFVPCVDALDLRDQATPHRRADEVLVVIATWPLHFVMDIDILHLNRSLKMAYDVNPDLLIHVVVSGAYNTPFFSMRFKEALFHFTCLYDVLDTFTKNDDWARLVFESEVLGKAILNVVACEGLQALERVKKYKQWQTCIKEAGMQQLPIDVDMLEKVQALLQSYHKDYMAYENRRILLLGWKGRTLFALSAWKSPLRPG